MKVSTEWKGHAHNLRIIASMLMKRPTLEVEEQTETLLGIADQLERSAKHYAEEFETKDPSDA